MSIVRDKNVFEYIQEYDPFIGWDSIIIHHSETKDGKVVDAEQIDNYHTNVLKWKNGCGYHFLLELVNGRYEYIIGRSLKSKGAHCYGHNDSIGICVVGNYNLVEPSHQQYFELAALCRELMRKYPIEIKNVLPHWVYSNHKVCPGKLFSILKLRSYIRGLQLEV